MNDTPQHANAAQMAARKLKGLPKKGGSMRNRPAPVRPEDAPPLFAPMPGEPMFGGSVQAPGTFSFSGVPQISFGGNTANPFQQNTNTAPEHEPENGRWPGDDRGGKRRSGGPGSTFTPASQQSNSFNSTSSNPWGQAPQNNVFGNGNQQQALGGSSFPPTQGGFSFNSGQSATPSAQTPSNIFGNVSSTTNSTTPNIFSFGSASQPPAAPSISSASAPFAFGNSSQAPVASTSGSNAPFSFGSTSQAPVATEAKPASVPFTFGSVSQAPAASTPSSTAPFSFGNTFSQAPPQSPSISHGTLPGQANSGSNVFNPTPQQSNSGNSLFGPQDTKPTNIFATSQAGSTSNTFNFNQPAPSAVPPPTIFGSSAPQQEQQPQASPFKFGQTSSSFGSTPASAAPLTNNLFGTSQTPVPQQSNIFSNPQASQTPQLQNMFAPQASQANQAPSLFSGRPGPQAVKIPNGFGSQHAPQGSQDSRSFSGSNFSDPPSLDNLKWGTRSSTAQKSTAPNPTAQKLPAENSTASEPSAPFSFGNSPAPSTSLQNGHQNQSSAPLKDVFSKPVGTSSTNNLFGAVSTGHSESHFGQKEKEKEKDSSSGGDPFGTLNKPVDQSVMESKTNNSLFSRVGPQATPLSGTPVSKPPGQNFSFKGSSQAASVNGNPPSFSEANGNTIDAPAAAQNPPPNGMFPSLSQTTGFSQQQGQVSGREVNNYAPKNLSDKAAAEFNKIMRIKDAEILPMMPSNFDERRKSEFCKLYRLRALNVAMANMFKELDAQADPTAAIRFYQEERRIILGKLNNNVNASAAPIAEGDREDEGSSQSAPAASTGTSSKRKTYDDQENENPSKRTRQFEPSTADASNELSKTNGYPSADASNGAAKQNGNPFAQLAKPQQNGNSPQVTNFLPPTQQQSTPFMTSPSKGKRKGDDLTKDTEEENPLKKRQKATSESENSKATSGSNTSKSIEGILDGVKSSKKLAPLPGTPRESREPAPRANPFGNLPGAPTSKAAPSNPFANLAGASSPAKSLQAQSSFTPKPSTTPSANPFQPKVASATPAPAATSTPTPSSFKMTNPVDPKSFLGQFSSDAAQIAKDKRTTALNEAICKYEEDNDDEEPPRSWKVAFLADYDAKLKAKLDEVAEIAKNAPTFKFKADETSAAKDSSKPASTTNIFSQSSQGSSSSIFGTQSTSKSLFSQPSQESGKNLFNAPKPVVSDFFSKPLEKGVSAYSSRNGSRASSPGQFGSSTGSIFEGVTRGATPNPTDGPNIFEKYAKKSGSEEENHEESSEEGSDVEDDSENQDPTYQPAADTGSGPGTPGTPADETGAGIASAKKANPFSGLSGTSTPASLFNVKKNDEDSSNGNSGTTTPGRSLFDRIPHAADGKPIKAVVPEEKENTQPSTKNIFGSIKNPFTKSTALDQTWKPDSPIKFGSTTSSNNGSDTAPVVNVTAATPTKGSPSNIFGQSTTPSASPTPLFNFGTKPAGSTPNFGSLFGTSTSKPSTSGTNVGFAFGGASTSSSLLPSTAGSATTSRATSPGATTDGEGSQNGDPDSEKHEQIDLTAPGGAGEENEEILFQVRAKIQKFETTEEGSKAWVLKGVGPLRVLRDKDGETAARILVRQDPRGNVVMNKALLKEVGYEAKGKTVKVLTVGDGGEGMETWMVQVKTEESAKELAACLEENKS